MLRVPPQDIGAEQAVLCACFIRSSIIPQLAALLSPPDFYREAHQHIFEAMIGLGKGTDLVTLADRMKGMGRLETVGGMDYLSQLQDFVSTSIGWQKHAQIVKEHSQRRQVITACQVSEEDAHDQSKDLPDVLSGLKGAITAVEREQAPEIESSLTVVQQVFRDIEKAWESGNRFVGIRTGLENIDTRTSGLEPGSTTYLIARPSIGKSSLALTIGDWVAAHEGPVLFFSLESNRQALTRRRIAARSGLHLTWIRTGDIRDEFQWEALHDACGYLSDKPMMIVDHSRYRDPQALVSLAETVALTKSPKIIIVDHIGLCAPKGVKSPYERASVSSDILQSIPKLCNCHLLILCQLSREFERRSMAAKSKQYPALSDMRDSGKLEENADNVWGLHRDDKEAKIARLEQLKGRDSGTWVTWLNFDRFCQRFEDGEEPIQDQVNKKPSKKSWQDKM